MTAHEIAELMDAPEPRCCDGGRGGVMVCLCKKRLESCDKDCDWGKEGPLDAPVAIRFGRYLNDAGSMFDMERRLPAVVKSLRRD